MFPGITVFITKYILYRDGWPTHLISSKSEEKKRNNMYVH